MIDWLKIHAFKIIMALIGVVGVWQVDVTEIVRILADRKTNIDNQFIQNNKDLMNRINVLEEQSYLCVKEKDEAINSLKGEINRLKNSFILLETSNDDNVQWTKDKNSIIISVSKGYIDKILTPSNVLPTDFIGTNGYPSFPKEVVQDWLRNDSLVMKKEDVDVSIEKIPNGTKGISIKRPISTRYGGVLGTKGIWIDFDLIKEALKKVNK